jgi:predicted flap endonuclease-1-like 5' DNA nuclease
VVDRPVDKIVEKIIDRPVDSPALLAQIASLTAAAALVPSLREQLAHADRELAELRPLRAPAWPAVDIAAAKAAGFSISGDDDLKIVEGIGPKIEQLLHAAGVKTFAQLAQTSVARLREILDAAGPHYRISDPATWPEQSLLCARNEWVALKALQDSLTAGRR